MVRHIRRLSSPAAPEWYVASAAILWTQVVNAIGQCLLKVRSTAGAGGRPRRVFNLTDRRSAVVTFVRRLWLRNTFHRALSPSILDPLMGLETTSRSSTGT
jgi:hypothetical protein